MCSVCYGIGNCPVCEPDEKDNEKELDQQLNDADDWYQAKREEEQP